MDSKKRGVLPIMTHPGIEMIGREVYDAVTDGRVHYEAIKAVNEAYPQSAAATVIMDLTVEAEAFGSEISFPEKRSAQCDRPSRVGLRFRGEVAGARSDQRTCTAISPGQ